MKRRFKNTLLAATALFALAGTAQAAVIFSHSFSGTSANLHGTAPDVRPGTQTWVAHSSFKANGSITADHASATLAWTPASGTVYYLDARFANMTTASSNWIGAGFATGSSTGNATGNRFTEGSAPVGKAWAYIRSNSTSVNDAILGSDSNGISSSVNFTSYATSITTLDLRIVLDTTAGDGPWTATWLAKLPSESDYTVVRATTNLVSKNITTVGLTKNNGLTGNVIQSFSLTQIPEPTTALFGSLGMLFLLRRRR
jgi:hypothetical protein